MEGGIWDGQNKERAKEIIRVFWGLGGWIEKVWVIHWREGGLGPWKHPIVVLECCKVVDCGWDWIVHSELVVGEQKSVHCELISVALLNGKLEKNGINKKHDK